MPIAFGTDQFEGTSDTYSVPAPSAEQSAILDLIHSGKSVSVQSVAGSGKTSLIMQGIKHCGQQGHDIAIAAYNRPIADDIRSKLPYVPTKARVFANTVHGYGLGAIKRRYPRTEFDKSGRGSKGYILCEKIGVPYDLRRYVRKMGSLLKGDCAGMDYPMDPSDPACWDRYMYLADTYDAVDLLPPEFDFEFAALYVFEYMHAALEMVPKLVDYDDYIWAAGMPSYGLYTSDTVYVDEAQDLSEARRRVVAKMLGRGAQVVVVGDPYQAIYGFNGADTNSFYNTSRLFNCVSMPLNTCYRCSRAVIKLAQTWVPHIVPRDGAPEGSTSTIDENYFWRSGVGKGDAVLCRLNAPMMETYFNFLRRGVRVRLAGTAMADDLTEMINNLGVHTVRALMGKLDYYLAKRKKAARADDMKTSEIEDKVQALTILATHAHVESTKELIDYVYRMCAADSEAVTLSSIHRAKGLEWNRVFGLGRHELMPSPQARQDWQVRQETNLMYVMVTRAHLDYVDVRLSNRK